MLFQEWNWDDAKEVWQREAAEREREKWMPALNAIVSEKDAYIAELEAQLKKDQ